MSGVGLGELQRHFLRGMQGRADGDASALVAEGRLPAATGLRIYAHAYGARLREALENDHPVLGTYLGDALWERLCVGYTDAHPSQARSLRDFGAALPDFLARDDAFRVRPQIAELARFERRLLDAFDAADAPRADWETLTARPESRWPALRLRFHPSLQWHEAPHGSVGIWRAIRDGQAPPAPSDEGAWVLWRDEDRVTRFRSLDAHEDAALQHMRHGGDFAGLCGLLAAWWSSEEVPAMALTHLRSWCAEGWVARWV